MTLFRDLRRVGALVLAPAVIAAALLAACGGGTEQVQAFKPARLIVFGDENSMIENDGGNDGFKYTVNDRSTTAVGRCQALPIFAQAVASHYGFVFAQCNPLGIAPKAFIQALRLAKVDDPSTGLSQQVANQGDLNARDMVTVMIGSYDIIELYERSQAGMSSTDALAEAQRRGSHVADKVNAILKTGARALVFTIPDLSLSPYAVNAAKTNPGAPGQLANLTYEFNAYLRTRIDPAAYDGRNYGLVLADDIVAAMAKTPTTYLSAPAVANVAACANLPDGGTADDIASAVLSCDVTTLVTGAASNSHLWASDRHLGPNAHSRIGDQAVARAANNPF
jgi:hypothetical protein